MLRSRFFTAEQVEALVTDYRSAGLEPVDEAIAAFTERVVLHAEEITQAEIDGLRAHGLDDSEIFDIMLAATARILWSRLADATGYEPPDWWLDWSQPLLGKQAFQTLSVGRQFVQSAASIT